jgi:hypothetical protein
LLLSEQVEKKREKNTDDDACGDREVKLEVVFLDYDVAGQLSQPRHPWRYNHQNTHGSYDYSHNDESFYQARQWIHGSDTNSKGSSDTRNYESLRALSTQETLAFQLIEEHMAFCGA